MTSPDRLVRRLAIGVGNDFRGDDGAGLSVIRRIRDNPPPGAVTYEENGDGTRLIDSWEAFEDVVIVDAASSGKPPGTVFRFDALSDSIPEGLLRGCSTHTMGTGAVIELARTLNRLPSRLTVYGIEGRTFAIGAVMSPEVLKAIDDVEHSIRREWSGTAEEHLP
jgi:hydrogenase maturation protease